MSVCTDTHLGRAINKNLVNLFLGFFEVNYTQFTEESALANYTNIGGDYAQSSDVDINSYTVKISHRSPILSFNLLTWLG